jgi:hypothetical protein
MKAGKAFSQWGAREVEVLASLPKCGSLLAWLATNIRDRSDLKTFYDLATIAAGESDHELDRVTHFYQVELRIHLLLLLRECRSRVPVFLIFIMETKERNCEQFHFFVKLIGTNLVFE